MGVYDSFIESALRLIKAKGGPIKVRSVTTTVADGAKRWRGGTATPTDNDGFAVLIDYDAVQAQSRGAGSRRMLIPASGLAVKPTRNHIIVDAAVVAWKVLDVKEINPNFVEPILFDCEVTEWQRT